MKSTSETVVFFGSGPVAAKSLELLRKNVAVEAIITKPATLHDMKRLAGQAPVFSVKNKAELDELIASTDFKSRLAVLIDFGVIISQPTIDHFDLGILNSHFSILPEWRGADPITYSILSGQEVTGVSLMFLTAGMDEGPIVSIGEQPIDPDDTTETLTDKLIVLSDALLTSELPRIFVGKHNAVPQEVVAQNLSRSQTPTYSQKLTKEDGRIDWHKPAVQLEREIRAFQPWPKSYTTLSGIELIIKKARVTKESGPPSTYKSDKKSLRVYCGSDALDILILQPAGKKEMPVQAFLAGYSI